MHHVPTYDKLCTEPTSLVLSCYNMVYYILIKMFLDIQTLLYNLSYSFSYSFALAFLRCVASFSTSNLSAMLKLSKLYFVLFFVSLYPYCQLYILRYIIAQCWTLIEKYSLWICVCWAVHNDGVSHVCISVMVHHHSVLICHLILTTPAHGWALNYACRQLTRWTTRHLCLVDILPLLTI